ncbi:hypothetical protein [Alloactinosynnema sp. L-07]|uniref:DUF5403 family protein n=1 Tax=Alloactinosynnema sp. L-07 TaxID=1653480 RepID=UPI00065F03A0|nr:DUF5403 family protein [Alloactinosynnema sp. L-07]CRK59073.1 hypothetical protein [Alloactinosynnema sp. L-07]
MAKVYDGTDDFVAHLPEVRSEVRKVAEQGAARATAILAGHKHTGAMHIEVTHGIKTDSFVSLVDPDDGAVAAEFGHISESGRAVPGINVLKTAFDL